MKTLKEVLGKIENLDEKNKPTSPDKWARAKAAAKSKFAVYPSAYANAWASKKYKSMGGGWRSTKEEFELEEEQKKIDKTKIEKFHKKLDTLVHSTFGKRPDEKKMKEDVEVIWEAKDEDEDDMPDNEVEVFDYDTNYFHVCPLATKLYKDIEDKIEDDEYDLFEGMAKLQDCIFFIEKHLKEKKGSPKEDDMGYLLMAQNIKDQLDRMLSMTTPEMRMEHGYLQGHIETIKELLDWENRKEELDEEYEWLEESAAWKRKEGKSPTGGLNAKGIASYRRENPGSKLKMAVTGKVKPGSKAAKRRKSFCARMSGMKGPMKKPNGEPTRKALSLRKWKCR